MENTASGAGVQIVGTLIGLDIDASGGIGVDIDGTTGGMTVGASNGNAFAAVSTGGNGSGIVATKHGSGYDIDADIHGTLDTVTTLTTKTGFSLANASIVAATFGAGAVNAAAIAAAAIDNATFAADVGSTAYASNIIALAVRKVLDELSLDGDELAHRDSWFRK